MQLTSWRFWCLSAAAAVSIVVYNEIHGTPSEVGSYRYQTLGRERVLLMNDDANTTCPIDYESLAYSQKSSLTNRKKYKAFWTFVETDTISFYNLQANPYTELHVSDNGNPGERLWTVMHCRHGNTFSTSADIRKVSNYLPFASTSKAINNPNNAATETTAGQIVMQNTLDAQVISSCYPDGIGTVYFDAVNAFVGYLKGKIAVDVAYGVWKTNTTGALIKDLDKMKIPDDLERDANGNFVPPDDAHCDEVRYVEQSAVSSVTETTPFKRVAWARAKLVSVENANGTISKPVTNDVVELKMATGNSSENFYRAWAPIADLAANPDLADFARGPMRFRLKRVDRPQDDPAISRIDEDGIMYKGTGATYEQRNALLLVDNVIASYPAMKAWAIPAGEYVNGGSARNVIGWTGVVSTNYPAVGMTGLRATAGLSLATNNAPAGVSPDVWMAKTEASLTWRWRYMDQAIGEWKDLPLAMQSDGTLASEAPMELPQAIGDVELRYVTTLDAPYYGYVDYSGSKKFSADDPTPGYSEQIRKVSSQLNPAARGAVGGIPLKLPSRGTDFFFRLRSGASEQLEYRIEVCRADSAAIVMTAPCWLTADNTWKTYLKTTTNETSATALVRGTYRFRIRGVKPDVAFKGETAMAEVPWTAQRLTRVDDPSEGWTAFTVDSATDALMFQIAEDPAYPDQMTYTVVHASFQDFNSWTDAVPAGDPVYTGAYYEGRGKKSGSSPDAREYPCELDSWNPLSTLNAQFWTENFTPDAGHTPLDGYDGHRAYTPFTYSMTPNGWEAIGSMWVCSKWRESVKDGDMALQLGGFGDGYLNYVNTAEMPHGINEVNFKARIAQSLAFENFAYYLGGALTGYKDYIFSTRAAMATTDASTEFDGNGSISLVGYYQPGTGCYELRAERIANNTIRFYLYKWLVEKRKVTPKLLGYHTTTRGYTTQTYLRCSNKASTESEQTSASFGNLFIRCQTVDGNAVITAGVMDGSKKLADSINATHYVLKYTDADADNPLTYGTFGFASVNCPAWIIKPMFYSAGNTGTFPNVTSKSYSEDANGKQISVSNPTCGSGTVTYPSGKELFVDVIGGKYADWAYSNWDYERELVAKLEAVAACPPSGEVAVYVNGADEPVTNMTVNGFRYNPLTARVRNTVDSLVTISTGADSDDIVVDSVSFDQWSAGSYDDEDNSDFADKLPNFGSPTNFVYVNGWVRLVNDTQHVIDLQPVRAVYDTGLADYKAVSVRAPLMDGREGRGKGLGLLSYTYVNADPRCRVLVQYRDDIDGTEYLNSYTKNPANWKTVATNDFSSGDYDLKGGTVTTYVGVHGVKGAMRLLVDPQVVRDAQSAGKNPGKDPAYGQITITDFRATDEPELDGMCWWGWNLRTTDLESERSIVDSVDGEAGLALALNNSVTDQTEPDPGESDADRRTRYAQNLPFVQTPTFYTNLINEVSFSARRMAEGDPVTEVAILGAKDGGVSEPTEWKWLKTIKVESLSYETYSYKAKPSEGYRSFRIAVIGVDGVDPNHADRMAVPPPPPRILLDEVSVSEGVYGQVGFFDVGAFRTPLDKHVYIDPGTNLFTVAQQPRCEESWTVQCEVRATQLKEEVKLDDTTEVTLHWYKGTKWGYVNWAGDPAAKSAPLARIRDQSGFVFRGSYSEAPGALVEPSFKSGDVVQFMLEVKYRNADGAWADPYFLQPGEWTKPAWYRGIDYNATRGGFAAYTILDTVAYGYAWINEVNVYDGPSSSSNRARTNQWVEVALPAEASLDRWRLQFITGGIGDSNPFYTNTVVTYRDLSVETPGYVPPKKPKNKHMDADSGYVFLTAASPATVNENPALKAGFYVDGSWAVGDDFNPDQEQLKADGTLSGGYPVGIRLVRPSGVIEDEVVVIGTNIYARLGEWEAAQHSPTNFVNRLRKAEGEERCYFTGEDDGSNQLFGRSQTNQFAASETDWAYWPQTPGRINADGSVKQRIVSKQPPLHQTMVVVYANLEGGHVTQSYGDFTNAAENLVLYVPKGLTNGTNIVYHVADWYELASVAETEAGVEKQRVGPFLRQRRVEVPIAKNASNDITVVASTQLRHDLETDFGLGLDNPYRAAVVAWLEGNATQRGKFRHKGDEIQEIRLARLEGLDEVDRGEMSLTDMYWFDMDPTWEGQVFRMGMIEAPTEKPMGGKIPYEDDDGSGGKVTNLVMQVFMMISNKVDDTFIPYAPYTLNGRKPGSSSDVDSSDWDSETFKITGIVNNGSGATIPRTAKWLPLRYFVFGPDSFKGFRSTIEIIDPFSPLSPAYYQGWDRLKGKPTFFSFSIDTRTAPVSPEVLNWDSTLK